MHGTENLKFINAKQARNIYEYNNIKRKLRQEPNGSITAAQDTPDGGPVKARNM
jgi:hypothetical protein